MISVLGRNHFLIRRIIYKNKGCKTICSPYHEAKLSKMKINVFNTLVDENLNILRGKEYIYINLKYNLYNINCTL